MWGWLFRWYAGRLEAFGILWHVNWLKCKIHATKCQSHSIKADICHVKNGACDVGDEKRTESRYSNGKFQFGRFIWKTKTFSYERQLDENERERERVHPFKWLKESAFCKCHHQSVSVTKSVSIEIVVLSFVDLTNLEHNMLIDCFQMLTNSLYWVWLSSLCLIWDECRPLKHTRMVCARDFAIIFRIFGTIYTTSFAAVDQSVFR